MFPAADDDRHLDAALTHAGDLGGDAVDLGGVGAVIEVAHQRLAGELQQDAGEPLLGRRLTHAYSSPTRK